MARRISVELHGRGNFWDSLNLMLSERLVWSASYAFHVEPAYLLKIGKPPQISPEQKFVDTCHRCEKGRHT